MRRFFRTLATLAVATSVVMPFAPVFAAPPPDVFKDAEGNVIAKNLTPNAQVTIEFPDKPTVRTLRADFCGRIAVSSSDTAPITSTIVLQGTPNVTIDTTALPVLGNPSCVDNTLAEARPNNYKTTSGTVYIVGKTPGLRYDVQITGAAFRQVRRPNACNFLVIRNTTEEPIGASVIIGGTTHTVATLPVSAAPSCRTTPNGGVMFVPSTWL
jgi:hypothetical protein